MLQNCLGLHVIFYRLRKTSSFGTDPCKNPLALDIFSKLCCPSWLADYLAKQTLPVFLKFNEVCITNCFSLDRCSTNHFSICAHHCSVTLLLQQCCVRTSQQSVDLRIEANQLVQKPEAPQLTA